MPIAAWSKLSRQDAFYLLETALTPDEAQKLRAADKPTMIWLVENDSPAYRRLMMPLAGDVCVGLAGQWMNQISSTSPDAVEEFILQVWRTHPFNPRLVRDSHGKH